MRITVIIYKLDLIFVRYFYIQAINPIYPLIEVGTALPRKPKSTILTQLVTFRNRLKKAKNIEKKSLIFVFVEKSTRLSF